jgi:hypothetical protein
MFCPASCSTLPQLFEQGWTVLILFWWYKVKEELNKYSSGISGVPHFVVWIWNHLLLSSFSYFYLIIECMITCCFVYFRSMESINSVVVNLQTYSWGPLRRLRKMELNDYSMNFFTDYPAYLCILVCTKWIKGSGKKEQKVASKKEE